MGGLARLEKQLKRDLTACADAELEDLAGQIRAGIAQLEGFLTRVAGEARRREAAGEAVVASDLIRGRGELSRERAETVSARAAVVEFLPQVGAAISAGRARPENADAVAVTVRRLSSTEQARLAADDADLARRVATEAPETFTRGLRRRVALLRDRVPTAGLSAAEREQARSFLDLGRRPNGRWWLQGELAGEWGAVVDDRLRARARQLAGTEKVTPNHLARALHDLLAEEPGDSQGGLGRARMGVGYIVDAATLFGRRSTAPSDEPPAPGSDPTGPDREPAGPMVAPGRVIAETWGGEPVDPDAMRRLACDADLYAIVIDLDGRPVRAERTHRSATRWQRLQLRALYPTCPLDGTTPFERCEIHHVNRAHRHGGVTALANLVPISERWHHRIHDLGWQLTMRPDRTLELRSPDGSLHRIVPPPVPITRQRE